MVRRRKRSKKWIFWLFFLILLIAAGYVCYAVWDGYFNNKKEETTTEEEKKDEGNEIRVEENEEDEKGEEGEEIVQKEEVVQYDGENPNNSGGITGVVTYAGVSGNKLMIRMNIDQYLSGGECDLRLIEDGDEIYNDVVGLESSAATTTCMGFDIPVAAIGGGSFQIIIDVNSGGKNGTITGEVSI